MVRSFFAQECFLSPQKSASWCKFGCYPAPFFTFLFWKMGARGLYCFQCIANRAESIGQDEFLIASTCLNLYFERVGAQTPVKPVMWCAQKQVCPWSGDWRWSTGTSVANTMSPEWTKVVVLLTLFGLTTLFSFLPLKVVKAARRHGL